jgi:hypothetical protein
MRLQEPVNGIKVAVGHLIIHLCFIFSMFEIDTDITINLNSDNKKEYKAVDDHRLLGSSSSSGLEVIDPMETK